MLSMPCWTVCCERGARVLSIFAELVSWQASDSCHRLLPAKGIWKDWGYLHTQADTAMPVGEVEDHVILTDL